jgi:enoyl-CoA hydratase/carnithine racemase
MANSDTAAAGSYTTIDYTVQDRILTITLNRPGQLNAFTITMADELEDAFTTASSDDEVAAVVVTGAGRAFCAGMDLSVPGNVFGLDESLRPAFEAPAEGRPDPALADGVRDTGGRVALSIFNCTKPVIGAINGPAVGIGATMTLPMDARLASADARIGFVFGRLGIVCEACSSWFLPRIVGIPQALDWLYSADIFDAAEARAGGLVRSVHEPAELLPAAYALAHRFTDNRSPAATALMRQMIYRNSAERHPLAAHRVESLGVFYTSINDGKEGVRAFAEKRPARFTRSAADTIPGWTPWSSHL